MGEANGKTDSYY